MDMKKALLIGSAVLATTGLGYGIYRLLSKSKSTKQLTPTNVVSEEASVTVEAKTEEVDEMSATNKQHFYAACKELASLEIASEFFSDADKAKILVTTDFGDDLKLGESKQFFDPTNKAAGFITATRYGNVVVWQYAETDGELYRLECPERTVSVLPDFLGVNYWHYVKIGNLIEQLAIAGEG